LFQEYGKQLTAYLEKNNLTYVQDDLMKEFKTNFLFAGKSILIKSNHKKLSKALSMYFPEFQSKKKADLTLDYDFREGNFELSAFMLKDRWRSKEKIKEIKKNVFVFSQKKGKNGMILSGTLDLNKKKGEFRVMASKNFFWGMFIFSLAKCLSIYLSDFNANIIHSSAIIDKNKAILFSGKNDSGKTTILYLCSEKEGLGEDLNFLFKKGKDFFVQVFPLIKMVTALNKKNSKAVKLKAITFLAKNKKIKLKKLSKTEAITSLLQNDIQGTFNFQKIKLDKRILLYQELFSEVPAFILYFPFKKNIWRAIEKKLDKAINLK